MTLLEIGLAKLRWDPIGIPSTYRPGFTGCKLRVPVTGARSCSRGSIIRPVVQVG